MSINTEHFKQQLLLRKAEIENLLKKLNEDILEISKCEIKDEGGFASIAMDSDREYQLGRKLQEELKEINDALDRIANGTYGICEMCEEPINPERLAIKPYAKYCIICREEIEKEGKWENI